MVNVGWVEARNPTTPLPEQLIQKYAYTCEDTRNFGVCEEIIGAIDDRNDVEKNIYENFRRQALRDCPTGVLIDVEGCEDEW